MDPLIPKVESSPCYLLSVRIIQAQHILSRDLWTFSDCYVTLWLPSASNKQYVTKTIPNTSNPVWNETFHFLIQSQVKNVLELNLYDEDVITKDDLLFTVTYDVAKLSPGDTVYENFILNSERKEILKVEFKMESICSEFESIITNGIVTAREVLCLRVQVDKQKNETCLKENNIQLMVKESFEEVQKITEGSKTFSFHCVKHWEPILETSMKNNSFGGKWFCDTLTDRLGVPLKYLPQGEETEVDLLLAKDVPLKLQLKVNDCSQDLDVRLGCDLCVEEHNFLSKRKTVVANALKKILLLDQDLQMHEVPVVAVMATGGGARAMTAFYGHLSALQKLNILDCVTYLTGASGSTWTMRSLYEDTEWSQRDLTGPIHKAQEYITQSKSNAFSLDSLKRYDVELKQRAQDGHSVSFTDVWSLIIDRMFHDEHSNSKLSNQQEAVSYGQNPLPLYVALNVKEDTQSTFGFREWCEFSPYEVGFSKYGAFIRTEDFGSEFFMGRLMNKRPESRICYLEGIWSNIFSLNLVDVWNSVHSLYNSWEWPFLDKVKDGDGDNSGLMNQPPAYQTAFTPSKDMSRIIDGILTHRPIGERKPNFLRGLQFHKDYYQHKTFSMWQDSNLDQCPNQLTPLEKELCLVDAGYFINTSCPPLLRQERNVDVILSFDYNLLETRFNSIEHMGKYCLAQKIPFPTIALSEEDRKNPKECYVFEDKDNLNAPIILHFPLVNDSFKEYKKPGIRRSPEEVAEGEVDFVSLKSPYKMTDLTYTEVEFNRLLNLSNYNVQNNRELILQALQTAVERRKANRGK